MIPKTEIISTKVNGTVFYEGVRHTFDLDSQYTNFNRIEFHYSIFPNKLGNLDILCTMYVYKGDTYYVEAVIECFNGNTPLVQIEYNTILANVAKSSYLKPWFEELDRFLRSKEIKSYFKNDLSSMIHKSFFNYSGL